MPEGFVALATLLRGATDAGAADASDADGSAAEAVRHAVPSPDDAREAVDVLGEIARLRLAVRDAFEGAVARLLADLAHDVLGRELALRPPDVDALVARALVAFEEHEPIEIVVSEADAASVSARTSLPIRADGALASGDLVIRVRDGAFESPRAFRLARVLGAARGE